MMRDYYKVMKVSRVATGEEIKKAYRSLALRYHPDRNQGDPACENRLKEVNEAYQILGDEEKRRQYDLSYDQEDRDDDLIEILRVFSRGEFGMRGLGGCKGMAFGKRGCRRSMRDF